MRVRNFIRLRSYMPCPASGNPYSAVLRSDVAIRIDTIARQQPFPFEIEAIRVGLTEYSFDELLKVKPVIVPAIDLEVRYRYVGDNPLGEEFFVEAQGDVIR